jgi:hypothetical protein
MTSDHLILSFCVFASGKPGFRSDFLVGGCCCFRRRLNEPGFEARFTKPGLFAGDQRALFDFRA